MCTEETSKINNDFGAAELKLYILALAVKFPWMEFSYNLDQRHELVVKMQGLFTIVCRGDTYAELRDNLETVVLSLLDEDVH